MSLLPDAYELRRATSEDADALARGAVEGVAGYVAFAPAGWAPPDLLAELAHTRVVLEDPAFHCFVAELDGALVGQVTVVPAAQAARPVDDPELGHLRNLYVARSQWGSGLAAALLRTAEQDARYRGLATLRLFVAEGQARARGFYGREGWEPAGPPFFDPAPGLTMLEYRRRLD